MTNQIGTCRILQALWRGAQGALSSQVACLVAAGLAAQAHELFAARLAPALMLKQEGGLAELRAGVAALAPLAAGIPDWQAGGGAYGAYLALVDAMAGASKDAFAHTVVYIGCGVVLHASGGADCVSALIGLDPTTRCCYARRQRRGRHAACGPRAFVASAGRAACCRGAGQPAVSGRRHRAALCAQPDGGLRITGVLATAHLRNAVLQH